jgi:CheY-like chemotaxis protein
MEASTAGDGMIEITSRQPEVVILDLGLPDEDGLDVIRKVREWSAVPVIVLSARGQEVDKVAARRQSDHASPAAQRGVGPERDGAGALPARLHGASAAELEADAARPRYLLTEAGVGYCWPRNSAPLTPAAGRRPGTMAR